MTNKPFKAIENQYKEEIAMSKKNNKALIGLPERLKGLKCKYPLEITVNPIPEKSDQINVMYDDEMIFAVIVLPDDGEKVKVFCPIFGIQKFGLNDHNSVVNYIQGLLNLGTN